MYARVILTSCAGTLALTLGFCPLSGLLPNGCTLMGFMVATESALRPRAYFSSWALTHFLEREVCIDR